MHNQHHKIQNVLKYLTSTTQKQTVVVYKTMIILVINIQEKLKRKHFSVKNLFTLKLRACEVPENISLEFLSQISLIRTSDKLDYQKWVLDVFPTQLKIKNKIVTLFALDFAQLSFYTWNILITQSQSQIVFERSIKIK